MLVSFCSKKYNTFKKYTLPKHILRKLHIFTGYIYKRMPACTHFKGSYTLEAAVIFPLFAGFMVSLLFFFRVMQIETVVKEALYYSSRMTALSCCVNDSDTVSLATAKALLLSQLKDSDVIKDYVRGGCAGVSILETELSEDSINISTRYKIKLPINFWTIDGITVEQHSLSHKWTGKVVDESDPDPYVYYTEYGSVYHTSKKCPYLDLSIRSVSRTGVGSLRNKSGRKYSACSCAAEEISLKNVYITDYGIEYHASLKCADLKRIIHVSRLSDVKGMRKCAKCKGE